MIVVYQMMGRLDTTSFYKYKTAVLYGQASFKGIGVILTYAFLRDIFSNYYGLFGKR